jgi:hypothetical protein
MKSFLGLMRAMRYWHARGGLPVWRQLAEMVVLRMGRGLGPHYYLLGRFWRQDVPWRDKWDHINDREYRAIVESLNPPKYQKVSQHKVIEKAMLTLLGFPTPRFLGYFHREHGSGWDGKTLRTATDLERLFRECGETKVVIKLVEGWGGEEFRAVELLKDGDHISIRDLANGEMRQATELANQLASADGYILESYLEQHETLAALNASSLNTVRLWILKEMDGYRFAGAILRVGRDGALVDNISAGGLVCPIELETGKLLEIRESHVLAESEEAHPDGGAKVAGVRLPHWDSVIQLAKRSLDAFPHMRFAGLDIAIASDGPRLIELNVKPDLLNALDFDVPLRQFFQPKVQPRRTGALVARSD